MRTVDVVIVEHIVITQGIQPYLNNAYYCARKKETNSIQLTIGMYLYIYLGNCRDEKSDQLGKSSWIIITGRNDDIQNSCSRVHHITK